MADKEKIKKQLSSFYKGNEAANYDALRTDKPADKKLVQIQKNITRELVRKSEGRRLLDVACGTGFFFSEYGNKEIYGVDISEDMLRVAASRHQKNVRLLKKTDACNTPFKSGYFDVALTSKFIMHTPEYLRALKEMARVTRQGGSLIVDLPNRNSVSFFFTKLRMITGKIRHYNFFTMRDIEKIADKLGLKVADIKGTTVLSYKFLPVYLYKIIDWLNSIRFLRNNFSYVNYVRFIKK